MHSEENHKEQKKSMQACDLDFGLGHFAYDFCTWM